MRDLLYKQTALHIAANEGFEAIAQLLLNAGADLNVLDFEENTPLHKAACNGYLKIVETLIAAKANPFLKNKRFINFSRSFKTPREELADKIKTIYLYEGYFSLESFSVAVAFYQNLLKSLELLTNYEKRNA